MAEPLSGIATNIITGFLGAGKSTAILDLISNKPNDENWAILVNEFGEVGIDGGLLSANHSEKVHIREVPGGCMCCSAGLPMLMAMNMLLARARPQRLIIEPTGLGHPSEVMNVLSSEHYRDVLDIHSTVTLVDARKITDPRYTNHATFNEQLEMGDVIAAKIGWNNGHLPGSSMASLISNGLTKKANHGVKASNRRSQVRLCPRAKRTIESSLQKVTSG
jgi:G3E family GTPase